MIVKFFSTPPASVLGMMALPLSSFLPVSDVVVINEKRSWLDESMAESSQRLKLWITSSAPNASTFDYMGRDFAFLRPIEDNRIVGRFDIHRNAEIADLFRCRMSLAPRSRQAGHNVGCGGR